PLSSFFPAPPTPAIYPLSLHDALPICADPAVHLRGGAGADDRSRDARPCQGPGDRYRRDRRAVPAGDRLERVAQREILAERRLLELGAAAAPVVRGERRDTRRRETVRQQPRLHRAVDDDAGVMLRTPGKLALGGVAPDQGERRLQGIHVP